MELEVPIASRRYDCQNTDQDMHPSHDCGASYDNQNVTHSVMDGE